MAAHAGESHQPRRCGCRPNRGLSQSPNLYYACRSRCQCHFGCGQHPPHGINEAQRFQFFSRSSLTTVLLASLGETNEDTLHTAFPDLAPYLLTPRQIVDTMLAKHGVVTGDDVSKLLTPLSKPLTSLSDLNKPISTFLLASQRLTRSGQGATAYNYFKLFLESVSGFPFIGMRLTMYYSAYPAIVNQSLTTLSPHLENMKD
jgi:hypothetical protein